MNEHSRRGACRDKAEQRLSLARQEIVLQCGSQVRLDDSTITQLFPASWDSGALRGRMTRAD